MGSCRVRIKACWFPHVVFIVVLSLLLPCILCQGDDDTEDKSPTQIGTVTRLMESKLSDLTKFLSSDVRGIMGYCIKNW